MNNLMQSVTENLIFVLEFLGIVVLMFVVAYAAEKMAKKKSGDTERVLSTRKIAVIGVFSAISFILMLLEFPVPFAPSFYELDFSEIPALIGTFAFGPVAGVMIEFCKILLKLIFKGTTTAFRRGSGEFCNRLQFPSSGVDHLPEQEDKENGDCGIFDRNPLHDGIWNSV